MNIFQKIYYGFLGLFFDNHPMINSYEMDDTDWHKLKNISIDSNVGINSLSPAPVLISNFSLSPDNIDICHCLSLGLQQVVIKSPADILDKSIKWIYKTVKLICVSRSYPLLDGSENLGVKNEQVSFSPKNNKVSESNILLTRKLQITEELIGIEPYSQKYDIAKVLKLPVIKTPISRSELSKNQMDFLREKLAVQSQTNKRNINILNVYDKFALGLFDSIKQSDESSEIKGYLGKDNKKVSETDIYYLVIGCRKDNNNVVKLLVKPKELDNIN